MSCDHNYVYDYCESINRSELAYYYTCDKCGEEGTDYQIIKEDELIKDDRAE